VDAVRVRMWTAWGDTRRIDLAQDTYIGTLLMISRPAHFPGPLTVRYCGDRPNLFRDDRTGLASVNFKDFVNLANTCKHILDEVDTRVVQPLSCMLGRTRLACTEYISVAFGASVVQSSRLVMLQRL
jgi:hypothetical protein